MDYQSTEAAEMKFLKAVTSYKLIDDMRIEDIRDILLVYILCEEMKNMKEMDSQSRQTIVK